MTNAERQKRYRDRLRGGPPCGRWAGHTPTGKTAEQHGSTRTMVFMASWIMAHAPEVGPSLDAGTAKMSPTYRRLRNQYIAALARALKAKPASGRHRLVESRQDGRFVFEWVPESAPSDRPADANQ